MIENTKTSKIVVILLWLTHLFLVLCNAVDRYSLKEQIALDKFRPLVQSIIYRDYMKEDYFLIRWLRARDLDVIKARTMLAKAIRWRRENEIDTILNETILEFPVTPYYYDSFSYSAFPVATVNIRAYEMKNLISSGKKTELLRFMDQGLEIGEVGVRYLSARFPYVRQCIVIYDFNGYNQRQQGCFACLLVFQEWVRHYENYFPQLIKTAFMVNAPRVIKSLLNVLKPVLSPASQKALRIFGKNRREWMTEVFKIVPRNQLRRGLGGTKSDHVPCAVHDFVCMCKQFFGSAGRGTNTTISLAAGLRKLDASIC